MKLSNFPTITASLLLLAAASGVISATAPTRQDSARHSAEIAEQMTSLGVTLSTAIGVAEKQVDGTAIAVRIAMGDSPYLAEVLKGEDDDAGITRPASRRPSDDATPPARPQDRPRDRDAKPSTDSNRADGARYQSDSMFAIVTCVIDRARVREVVVEMPSKKVIGVFAVPALRPGMDGFDEQQAYGTGMEPTMVRATDLMNATVRNMDGDRIGDIDELVIDPDTNRVLYGVLRRGGFLGMGESRYAIAPAELTASPDGTIQMNLQSKDFNDHPGFQSDNWPKRFDPEWSSTDADENESLPEAKQIVKASEIIGADVHCTDENEFGIITDLIVEPKRGRAVYAVIKAQHGNMVVPMSSLKRYDDAYRLDMDLETAKSKPVIEAGREPNWNDARWNRRVRESYGEQDGSGTNPKPVKRPNTPPAQPGPR